MLEVQQVFTATIQIINAAYRAAGIRWLLSPTRLLAFKQHRELFDELSRARSCGLRRGQPLQQFTVAYLLGFAARIVQHQGNSLAALASFPKRAMRVEHIVIVHLDWFPHANTDGLLHWRYRFELDRQQRIVGNFVSDPQPPSRLAMRH